MPRLHFRTALAGLRETRDASQRCFPIHPRGGDNLRPVTLESNLRPVAFESSVERAVFRWCAVALAAGIVVFLARVYVIWGPLGLFQLGNAAAFSFVAIGKFIIFAGLGEDMLSVWTLALMTFLVDLSCAFAMASGLAGLEKARVLGGWLRRARNRALEVLQEYPGLKRMAFFGVVAFVLIPLAGTGAITGSFVARILGLTRLTGVLAIAVASGWSALAFALMAHFLGAKAEVFLKSPLLAGASVVLFVGIAWLLYSRILKRLKA
jgi:uncharacterized membrane protein